MTKIHIEPSWSEVKPEGHYVYVHCRATDGGVFYVGKGKKNRAWQLTGRNKDWNQVAEDHGIRVDIVFSSESVDDAYAIERMSVSLLRDMGVDLVNKSDGGYGSRGHRRDKFERAVYCSNGMMFNSIKLAKIWLIDSGNEKAADSAITACCKGRRYMAYGYRWSYDHVPDSPEFSNKEYARIRSREVRGRGIYDSNGIYYPCLGLAVDAMIDEGYIKATHSRIHACASGKSTCAYGRGWSFYEVPEMPNKIPKRKKVQRSCKDVY